MHPAERSAAVAIGFVFVGLACVAALHVMRTDVDPVRQVLSEYANGRWGELMSVAFYALGAACLAVAFGLRATMTLRGALRSLPPLLALAGCGLIISGVFEVERPAVPDTLQESVHSYGSVAAFVLLIAAMVLLWVACRRDPKWRGFAGPALLLGATGTAAGVASPLVDGSPFTGIAQRILAVTVALWLLLAAWQVRRTGR
jgi:uncharacterized protein DUF998